VKSFKILDVYIGKTIIASSLMVLMILISLIYVFTLVEELPKIDDAYPLETALFFVLNKVPKQIYDFFPMAVLVGSLLGLGTLANLSELIVMRAAGYSVKNIITASMFSGVLMMFVVSMIGEFVVPITEKVALEIKKGDLTKDFTKGIKGGLWIKNDNDIIHIGKVLPDKKLKNIVVYTEVNNQLTQQKLIEEAVYEDKKWHLKGIKTINYQTLPFVNTYTKQDTISELINLKFFDVLIVPPEILPINDLLTYVNYLQKNKLDSGSYEMAFWQKILSPFSVLIMLILSIPFVFGSQRNHGAGHRILIGSIVGMGYLMLVGIAGHMGFVYGVPAFISVISPMLLSAYLAIHFARKVF